MIFFCFVSLHPGMWDLLGLLFQLSKVQDRMHEYVTQIENRENQLEGMRFFRRMLCEGASCP